MSAKYAMTELCFTAACPDGNPFRDVTFRACFRNGAAVVETDGFYDGSDTWRVRFLPTLEGEWEWKTLSSLPALDGKHGTISVGPAAETDHGPVRVAPDGVHFCYDDGTKFLPFGTTAYAWTSQPEDLIRQTLETLSAAPFNKIRMSPLPKHYDYNHNEPELFPFEGGILPDRTPERKTIFGFPQDPAYSFDYTRPNPLYWQKFDRCVEACRKLGIEVDLILFYIYDRWGFCRMGRENNLAYIRYVCARYSAYPNIWWSMANEWDLLEMGCPDFKVEDWERYAAEIVSRDPYGHLRSIHQMMKMYDHGKPWVTHLSLQKTDHYHHVTATEQYRTFGKPIIWDEVAYEGDIDQEYGNITGQEMTNRFWEAVMRGAYCTHGETYYRTDDCIWWAKGGWLQGSSPKRIAFLRGLMEKMPDAGTPITFNGGAGLAFGELEHSWFEFMPGMGFDQIFGDDMLFYLNIMQSREYELALSEKKNYRVSVIDTWNMTVTELPGTWTGKARIPLPGRPYMAVLARAV